jgi:hypothetical protein
MAVITCAVTGCDSAPPPPLLSPISVAGRYGYADVPLGDHRYQVSYLGPSQRSLRSPAARQETNTAERTQAFDFALWHAAQIALAQGFVGFRVSNIRTNVDSIVDESYDPFFAHGFYPHRRLWAPAGPYWGPEGWPSPYIYAQTQVVIDVLLVQTLDAGDYDAHDTIEQLNNTYPGAAGPAGAQPQAG